MSLIYSRARIKLPKIKMTRNNNNHNSSKENKISKLFFMLFIISILIGISITAVTPVFNQLCKDKAKSTANIIVSEATKNTIKSYNYSDFIIVHKDEAGKVLMLESNMVNINKVLSETAINVQKDINNTKEDFITISVGTFTGISIVSGRGFSVPIKISTIGNINTDVKSEFISQGINQTLHRLYMEIDCEISILTPFNTITEKVKNKVIIAENIIVGNTPETYYNLEGMDSSQLLDVVE